MTSIRTYFFVGLAIFVGLHWLANLPSYLFYGWRSLRTAGALAEVDLQNVAEIKKYVSQGYGSNLFALFRYINGYHNGIDIVAKHGAPVLSPASGKVLASGDQDRFCPRKNYGKFVVIETKNGEALLFAHLSKIRVDVHDEIGESEIIGSVGQTGQATAPHLHFTVFRKETFGLGRRKDCGPNPQGDDMNPMGYLKSL